MANLWENNLHNLKIKLDLQDYWDFFINKDSWGSKLSLGKTLYDKCLISYIDIANEECVENKEWLVGKEEYVWESAITTSSYTLNNIGYTGIDNGLIKYRRDRISNSQFYDIFTKSTWDVPIDARLRLHTVSGTTLQYDYPVALKEDAVELNGGFYQGFFETSCGKYAILPSVLQTNDVWEFEFTLKKCDLEKTSNKTLNDKYPDNKGIFFFLGARAENKWIYLYDTKDKEGFDECEELGVDDYLEDGEINKKDYIINNFSDPNPDFYENNSEGMDDYTNYNYYDNSLYNDDFLEDDFDLFDGAHQKRIINENQPHINLMDCCSFAGTTPSQAFVRRPFYSGCNCGRIRNFTRSQNHSKYVSDGDIFGAGDYIDGFDDLIDCENDYDYLEPELDISDFSYETDNGLKFDEGNQYYFYTDNKFLLFDRTCDGYNVDNWVEGTQMMYYGRKNKFKGNLFILMNRTATGYTTENIDDLIKEDANDYNVYDDIYNNALAFRITDDGSIGYRILTLDCSISGDNKTKMEEGYSFAGIIPDCEWTVVNVKVQGLANTMKLYFYVNGKLKYITKELPKINLRALNEIYEKQEGVPYNISLGGGTQGLAETVQTNYMLNPNRIYPLEEYFAGSFIGYLKSFRFYNCPMDLTAIENNYLYEKSLLPDS